MKLPKGSHTGLRGRDGRAALLGKRLGDLLIARDSDDRLATEEPYPLWRQYRRGILPALFFGLVALVLLAAAGVKGLVEEIYLELAEARARSIAAILAQDAPQGWQALLSGSAPQQVWAGPAGGKLRSAVREALGGGRIRRLKIYDPRGRVLFSQGDPAELGSFEDNPALREVIRSGERALVPKDGAEGPLYELYVPYRGRDGRLLAIFELYEPRVYLNRLVMHSLLPATALPGLLFLLLIGWLTLLVRQAQRAIDRRTRLLAELKGRLERFVSREAGRAAASGRLAGRRDRRTLFYSDVRDFSGLAELLPPEEVVAFVNRILSLQVEILERHGGDVDKMIGDAVFAHFAGADRAARALAAAREILAALRGREDLPRGVGIGLLDGWVLIGAVGPPNRQDYTALGDAVNVAARLCGAAASGELVVEVETLKLAGGEEGFGPPEWLAVKGRSGRLQVRRWRVVEGTGHGAPGAAQSHQPG